MTDLTQVVESGLSQVKGQVDEIRTELQSQIDELAQKGSTPGGYTQPAHKSVAATVADDAQLDKLRAREAKSVAIPVNSRIKAVVGDAGGVGDNAYSVQPLRADGVFNDPRRRLSLLDLLPSITVSSNSFEFIALDGFTDAADYQAAEGDTKAEQTMPTAVRTAPITTIAALLHASEQVLSDSPSLAQFIQARLVYGVRQKLEAEIIGGAGGTGQISGLMTEATTFTPTAGISSADAIGEALASLETAGWVAGAILMHPADWQAIRSERTTAGEYVATGWDTPAGPSLWNVPVVTSASMTEGNAIVMDTQQVMVLDRMSAVFAFGYTGDGFATNTISARGELRAGMAVMAPSAVLSLTIPPAA